jgi:Holliday junction DNA helicase RuvB
MWLDVSSPKEDDNSVQGNKMVKDIHAYSETAKTMKQIDFRPQTFDQVIGQNDVKENFKLKIAAFRKTRVSLVHSLLLGFSGVGKTTLANVVANEMGVTLHQIMATRIKTWADFYNIIKNVEENDIVFIDEIHALSPKIQEHLYGVMEDFTCTIEDKNLNRQILVRIPRFTLIGATTHSGDLNAPLLSRFIYKANLMPYSHEDLITMILTAGERIYDIKIPYIIADRLAQLSRRTARIAYNLLRSLMDVAEAQTPGKVTPDMITLELMNKTLKLEQIDPIIGLDYVSRKYIVALLRERAALGSRTLANYISEQESTITGMIEPFLFSEIDFKYKEVGVEKGQKGPFVRITKKGRIALQPAYNYIKVCQDLQARGWFPNESLSVKPE